MESLDGMMDGIEVQLLKADLYTSAAMCVAGSSGLPQDMKILGVDLSERDLRVAAEAAFRVSARQAKTDEQRWELVDRANQVRPMTWT
jgi:serine/threonine-protein kinase PknG